jgi:hypothetical protein
MIESLLTIAGGVVIGIWMYKRGYKDGYNKGAVDGYSVKK